MPNRLTPQSAGRLAAALPVLHSLEEAGELLVRADAIATHLPKEMKDLTSESIRPGSLTKQVLITLATRVNPQDRSERILLYQQHVAALRALIEDDVDIEGASPSFDAQDIVIFQGLIEFLTHLASRSQREVERFLDAIEGQDNAVLVIEYQAHRGQDSTFEARFAHDVAPETRTALKLRSPRSGASNKESDVK